MIYFDPVFLLFLLPGLALSLFAQWRVKSTYSKFEQVPNHQRVSGAQAARTILDSQGLSFVPIQETPGNLSDNYDPTTRTLNLSTGVARGTSVAAIAIAAHEVGHAVQHAQNYAPMRARTAIVPVVNIGANLGPILFAVSIMLYLYIGFTGAVWLAWAGVAFYSVATLFSLVTLPVELNASSRAMVLLTSTGLIDRTEYGQARQMLNAAALTYVAGLLQSLLQLLYYVMRASGMSRR